MGTFQVAILNDGSLYKEETRELSDNFNEQFTFYYSTRGYFNASYSGGNIWKCYAILRAETIEEAIMIAAKIYITFERAGISWGTYKLHRI